MQELHSCERRAHHQWLGHLDREGIGIGVGTVIVVTGPQGRRCWQMLAMRNEELMKSTC